MTNDLDIPNLKKENIQCNGQCSFHYTYDIQANSMRIHCISEMIL